MKLKIIENEQEYNEAIRYLDQIFDALPGSNEYEELGILALIIEDYEKIHYPIDLPDPIDAIRFRMEERGLKNKDLVPFIGSQSKVSEVMRKKVPLSLTMIRRLNVGLDIPAEILLHKINADLPEQKYTIDDYPFVEMYNKKYFSWFSGALNEAKASAEELLQVFFAKFENQVFSPVYLRSTNDKKDHMLFCVWQARVINKASTIDSCKYDREKLTEKFLVDLAKLSCSNEGPLLAIDKLSTMGITVIIEPHLKGTALDGACFKLANGQPIIGLTLRHDRVDNFFYTLFHELAHLKLHIDDDNFAFFDEIENGNNKEIAEVELQANQYAANILISPDLWGKAEYRLIHTSRPEVVKDFAKVIGVSPAIVAGRIRWVTNDYTRFQKLLGAKTIRNLLIQ